MTTFGLTGFPIKQSSSVEYFTMKFRKEGLMDFHYELFPLQDISGLPALIADNVSLCGLNVTIPHKVTVIPLLGKLDATAAEVGAVNTIAIIRKNNEVILEGYNTDVIGFEKSFLPLLTPGNHCALILGTGGASKAVAFVLRKNNILFSFVSRHPEGQDQLSYEDISEEVLAAHNIIINTTPLGKYPDISTFPPLPYGLLTSGHLLYDLNYIPEMTHFLQMGAVKGATVKSGLEMLHLQADASWKIWKQQQ